MSEFGRLLNEAAGAPPPLDMAAVRRRAARLGMRSRVAWWCAVLVGALGLGGTTAASVLSPARDSENSADERVRAEREFASRVVGVDWRVVSVRTGARQTPGDGKSLLAFDDNGRFSATACNNFGGQVSVIGYELSVAEIQTTQIACDDHPVEEPLTDLLFGPSRWRLDGQDLILVKGDVEIRLRRAAERSLNDQSP